MKYIKNKYQYLKEFYQQADNIYFKTDKIDDKGKKLILSITNGDNYTKYMSDLYYVVFKNTPFIPLQLHNAYTAIKIYDKNIFPIIGIDSIDDINVDNISIVYRTLEFRKKVIEDFSELPSVAKRNMKTDVYTKRNLIEMKKYASDLDYLLGVMKYVNNRSDDIKQIIYNKAFKNNISLSDVISFFDDKNNLLHDKKFSKNDILDIVDDDNDMEVVYDDNDVLIVRVESSYAIKKIGCTSFWCFTYGDGFNKATREWDSFSYNDMVYVIFDFKQQQNETDFMSVVIKPIDFDIDYSDDEDNETNNEKIYDMQNEPYEGKYVYTFLNNVLGLENAKEVLTFEY